MPINVNSFADFVRDWEGLLAAAKELADQLPNVEPHTAELQTALLEVKALKDAQDTHQANRQRATQELKDALGRGKDSAIKLRGFVKAKIGPRSELLVRFGVPPLRKRIRKPVEKPAPTEGEGSKPAA